MAEELGIGGRRMEYGDGVVCCGVVACTKDGMVGRDRTGLAIFD